MAKMIPESLTKHDTTAGERRIFEILRVAIPNHCIARYEVLLGEREYRPDFMIIDPERGILIVEVKDWGINSIDRAGAERFWITGMNNDPTPKPVRNPALKCELYLRWAREHLVAMPILCDQYGRLNLPVRYMLVFPNIERDEFTKIGLEKIVPIESVVFGADLQKRGQLFYQRYKEILPNMAAALDDQQANAISSALLPDIAIPHVTVSGFSRVEQTIVETEPEPLGSYMLSLEQEQLSKSIGEGPRLLRGIAGTGKTLIMLYRAKVAAANYLAKQKANRQEASQEAAVSDFRILILCWNASLATYMKQLYGRLRITADEKNVEIESFTKFVNDLAKKKGRSEVRLESPDGLRRLQAIPIEEADKYDAVYIDEAQDFQKEWIFYIFHNLIKGEEASERNLLIAADDAQRIYSKRDFRWSDLGIPMTGRSKKVMKTIYRNSARVWCFAAFLLKERAGYLRETSNAIRFAPKHAYDPELIACPSLDAQIDKAVETIRKMMKAGYAARNVLILYRGDRNGIVDRLTRRLSREKIRFDWIAEDQQAKRSFNWMADTVKISTVHSAKGMDSPVVIVLGADTFSQSPEDDNAELNLMYVALTRAREYLMVLYTGDGGLVPQLKECEAQYKRFLPQIVQLFESS